MKRKKKLKKRRQSFESFIHQTIKEVREIANFKDYKVTFSFARRDEETDGGRRLAAKINVDTRYLHAHITILPCLKEAYRDKNYNEVRTVICHELAHIRTQRLYDYAVERFSPEEDTRSSWETLTEEYGRLVYDKVCSHKK